MTARLPFVLGLTGSIGMGKSTTAGFFRELGVPVWDADAAVHRLYDRGGAAVSGIAAICPDAVRDGRVEREELRNWIARDPAAIEAIEAVVHPLVAADRRAFIGKAGRDGVPIVVVDVPLLFETGGDAAVDATLVVSAPGETQRARVMERPGMTSAHLEKILAAQMPDSEKRARADFVIETLTPQSARADVADILQRLKERLGSDA